jgi:hypothetical protein
MRRSGSLGALAIRLIYVAAAAVMFAATSAYADHEHRTNGFAGVKANTGYAMHGTESGSQYLRVSDDFKIPDAPAPHWQVVDSRGNVYLLQRLDIKGGKFNRQITLPSYIQDVAKVQIWCAWAEVLLGEASFDKPVR